MKTPFTGFEKLVLLALVGGAWGALCCTFPDAILTAIETLGTIFFYAIFALIGLGPILAGLSAMCSSTPPTRSPALRKPPPPPSPPSEPDTITPFLLGLCVGWWIGRGPGDGEC